jgi:hypothetical protein
MVKKEAIRAKLEQLYLEDPELLKSFMAARS